MTDYMEHLKIMVVNELIQTKTIIFVKGIKKPGFITSN